MKTHSRALTEITQGAGSSPEAFGSPGTSMRYLLFIWPTILPANPVQKPARSPPQTRIPAFYFVFPLEERDLLFHLGGGSSGANWRVTQWPGHLPEYIGKGAPFCYFY